jgi:hypothetical protein
MSDRVAVAAIGVISSGTSCVADVPESLVPAAGRLRGCVPRLREYLLMALDPGRLQDKIWLS